MQHKRAASINSDDFIDEDEDPELMNAIMASLLTPEVNDDGTYNELNLKDQEDERRILLEIMQISKLEEEKKKGKLSLDHLKRNKKPQNQDSV